MAKFTAKKIQQLFNRHRKQAKAKLTSLKFCSQFEPDFPGLNGWVFEQTIRDCLLKELKHLRIKAKISEQGALGGRAKADLLIAEAVAVEVKAGGLFDIGAAERYGKYKALAKGKGLKYLYITLQETHLPFKNSIKKHIGFRNAFFLDGEKVDEWQKFVNRVIGLLKSR